MRTLHRCLLVPLLIFLVAAEDSKSPPIENPRAALERIQQVVGGWRGVGQIQRNSTKGAWKETAQWVWDLKRTPPSLKITTTDGKYLKTGDLSFDVESQNFVLTGETADGQNIEYRGKLDGDPANLRLPLTSVSPDKTEHRVTINLLNAKRMTLLFEKKPMNGTSFQRVAEVGYTREGTRLAIEGATGKECVVTGGEGTIQVSYKGKNYWVCCSGCQGAFAEDPEGILKEYAARVAERNKKLQGSP